MPIRDIIVIGFLLWTVPHVIKKPWLGVLVWSWLSYMSPHRLCWGFAYDAPVALIAAAALIIGVATTKEKMPLPRHFIIPVWLAFIFWMNVTAALALNPPGAHEEWVRCMKIQFVTFLTMGLINTRDRIERLVQVIVGSIGFYGVKGGLFAIRTGFASPVQGPPGSFFFGNTEVGLTLLIILPLMRYVQLQMKSRIYKHLMSIALVLCALSIISTYSRGAFLAMGVAGLFLIWKSRQRAIIVLILLVATPVVVAMLPQKWFDRMNTIETYQQDGSAMGRINAWHFAFNLAQDRPLVGGGFSTFTPSLFYKYAPNPEDFHDAHSIYFEVLGEQGFVGLLLFLVIFGGAYFVAGGTARRARRHPSLQWAADLNLMLQVSLICYASGGAFLGLAYFDLPYHLVALVLVTKRHVDQESHRLALVGTHHKLGSVASVDGQIAG